MKLAIVALGLGIDSPIMVNCAGLRRFSNNDELR